MFSPKDIRFIIAYKFIWAITPCKKTSNNSPGNDKAMGNGDQSNLEYKRDK